MAEDSLTVVVNATPPPYDTYWSKRAIACENILRDITNRAFHQPARELLPFLAEADAHLEHAMRDTGHQQNTRTF